MSKQSDLVSVSQGASGDPLFIDTANDRVGVGTSSPAEKLDVAGTIRVTNTINSANFSTIVDGGGLVVSSGNNNPMYFYTGGLERARLDASGNLLVGRTSRVNAEKVGIYFTGTTHNGLTLSDTEANGDFARFFANTSTQVGSISHTSSSTSYNTTSDYRLKENVVPLAGAADRLAQIPVHRFNFIADPDRTVDGFLAHEVQEFVPECVTGEKDAVDDEGNPVYQGIDQSKLVPLLTAALQEALTKIDALEARIVTLEGGAA